jgi:hypothetical protein
MKMLLGSSEKQHQPCCCPLHTLNLMLGLLFWWLPEISRP